jgi:hypothetical protein
MSLRESDTLIKSAGSNIMKCDKCGRLVEGGRRKLNQHKKEYHSY